MVIPATATVNPGWNPTLGVNGGNDLAILTLSRIAPTNGTLRNSGTENMIMLFCYAPKGIVDHWQQELAHR